VHDGCSYDARSVLEPLRIAGESREQEVRRLEPRFDASLVASLDDPYPHYEAIRASSPVVRAGPATWAITRYADVSRLLRDGRLSHVFPDVVYRASGEDDAASEFFRAAVLNRDPPVHTVLRKAMARAVDAAALQRLRPVVECLVDTMLEDMAARDVSDVVADLASPLPVRVASELLRIPESDQTVIAPWAMALSRAFGAGVLLPEDRAAAAEAVTWLRTYVDDLLKTRLGGSADDPLSALLTAARADGSVPYTELVDNVIFLFFAGFDTTSNLIANGCAALLRQPELLAALRGDPSLARTAVEEFLRFDPPIQVTARITTETVEVGDRRIRPGRLVLLLLASANRDERQFVGASDIDIGRRPNPHLAFSAGTHHCLGANLARLETTVLFTRLATRAASFEPADEPLRRRHPSFRSFQRLPADLRIA
jgi:cytochrome P450